MKTIFREVPKSRSPEAPDFGTSGLHSTSGSPEVPKPRSPEVPKSRSLRSLRNFRSPRSPKVPKGLLFPRAGLLIVNILQIANIYQKEKCSPGIIRIAILNYAKDSYLYYLPTTCCYNILLSYTLKSKMWNNASDYTNIFPHCHRGLTFRHGGSDGSSIPVDG